MPGGVCGGGSPGHPTGKNAGSDAPGKRAPGTGAVARYLLAEPAALPKRASKRATRPPVSRIFCLPV